MDVLRTREAHRPGDKVMTGDLVDEPEHLLADLSVARVPLRRRAQLDEVHGLTRIELDDVPNPVAEGDQVAGLLREGVDDLAVRGFRLPDGDMPSLPQTGVDDRIGHLVPQ